MSVQLLERKINHLFAYLRQIEDVEERRRVAGQAADAIDEVIRGPKARRGPYSSDSPRVADQHQQSDPGQTPSQQTGTASQQATTTITCPKCGDPLTVTVTLS